MPAEPAEDELRTLCNLATKEEMGDLEFEARRDLPAFKDFPFMIDWPDAKPEIPEDFLVAIIGSGFSGLAMAVQCERLGLPYVLLERRPEPGGTWSVNRYPDIRVDTISITYEFNFEKEYRWSEYFGRGQEVREYLEHVSKKFGVYANTRFSHELKRATYDEDRDKWVLEADSPDGIVTFRPTIVKRRRSPTQVPEPRGLRVVPRRDPPQPWPATGRDRQRVGIVGTAPPACSSSRRSPRTAEQVFVFQRTPQWVNTAMRPACEPGAMAPRQLPRLLELVALHIAGLFRPGFIVPDEEWVAQGGHWNPMNDQLRKDLTAYIEAQTGGDQELIAKLVPDYAPFSRRPVVDNGWYKALTRDNVELVTDPIVRMTPEGVQTEDGTVYPIDTLVTATGFEVMKYLWPADYISATAWASRLWSKDGPRAYLSMMVPNAPTCSCSTDRLAAALGRHRPPDLVRDLVGLLGHAARGCWAREDESRGRKSHLRTTRRSTKEAPNLLLIRTRTRQNTTSNRWMG
jgi:4-hydroxyacetophenone monooxygenase